MLAKEYRLPSRTRFSKAHVIKTPFFLMRYQAQALPISRFAFVISKKTAKQAVVRNRIKRVFRHSIEEHLEELAGGKDVLFILSKQLLSTPLSEVEQILVQSLQKAGIISK